MALRKKAAATAAAETTAAPAAQEAEKKPAAKTRKAPAKRTPAAKKTAAPQVSLTLQYMGKELSQEDMVAAVKAQWTGEEIKTLALYVKPEDRRGDQDSGPVCKARGPGRLLCGQRRGQRQGGSVSIPPPLQTKNRTPLGASGFFQLVKKPLLR